MTVNIKMARKHIRYTMKTIVIIEALFLWWPCKVSHIPASYHLYQGLIKVYTAYTVNIELIQALQYRIHRPSCRRAPPSPLPPTSELPSTLPSWVRVVRLNDPCFTRHEPWNDLVSFNSLFFFIFIKLYYVFYELLCLTTACMYNVMYNTAGKWLYI